jgi:hypothetical protein
MENNRKEIQTMENKLEELEREHRILQQNDVIEGKMENREAPNNGENRGRSTRSKQNIPLA